MRVCGCTRLTETDRRNHVCNKRRENSKSVEPQGFVGSNPPDQPLKACKLVFAGFFLSFSRLIRSLVGLSVSFLAPA